MKIKLNTKSNINVKPTLSLKDQLNKPITSDINITTKLKSKDVLLNTLKAEPKTEEEPLNFDSSIPEIPKVVQEKYALLADSTDVLSQDVIDEFNLRMNYIIETMNNEELPNAMLRVLEYSRQHNELHQFLREDDISIFVKGARNSYARVAEKKTKNRTKKSKNVALDADIMNDLMNMDIEL